MTTSRKKVQTFFTFLTIGALCIYGVLYALSISGKPQHVTPITNHDASRLQEKLANDDDPYLFLKKERKMIISRALKNGENLLMRGKLFKLYRPTFSCPYNVARWGIWEEDGSKWVCGATELYSGANGRDCVVYSFGVGPDSSFEADILKYTNCKVYAYDHTVESIAEPLASDNPRVTFGKYGLADYKSIGKSEFKTIKELMGINDHKWIDILKLDVEGAEFDGMSMLMDDFDELPISQLQVELHVRVPKPEVYSKIVPWLNRLEEKGLRNFWAVPNPVDPAKIKIDCGNSSHVMAQYEYSFINVNTKAFRNSSFTFEKLLMGAAINTDLHYQVN